MAMTLRLTQELDQKLTETADNLGLSKQQVVDRAVALYLASMSERQNVLAAMDSMMEQDKNLMERLADA
jgi:predicted transcriptional regulator